MEEQVSENLQNSGKDKEKLNKISFNLQTNNLMPNIDSKDNINKMSQKKKSSSANEISINTLDNNPIKVNQSKASQRKIKRIKILLKIISVLR